MTRAGAGLLSILQGPVGEFMLCAASGATYLFLAEDTVRVQLERGQSAAVGHSTDTHKNPNHKSQARPERGQLATAVSSTHEP